MKITSKDQLRLAMMPEAKLPTKFELDIPMRALDLENWYALRQSIEQFTRLMLGRGYGVRVFDDWDHDAGHMEFSKKPVPQAKISDSIEV